MHGRAATKKADRCMQAVSVASSNDSDELAARTKNKRKTKKNETTVEQSTLVEGYGENIEKENQPKITCVSANIDNNVFRTCCGSAAVVPTSLTNSVSLRAVSLPRASARKSGS